jgi:hypothetical protein
MYSFKYLAYSLFIFLFLSCSDAEQGAEAPAELFTEKGINYADSTRHGLEQLLQSYYSLKDALVAADSIRSAQEAAALADRFKNFNLSAVRQSDPELYASVSDLPLILKKNAFSISKTSGLEAQRVIFQTVSDNLYTLIKNLKPAGIQTYQQYCPMAFDDKGAAWLSDTMHIQNPYFGKKMLTCGEVQDTLIYQ